MEKAEQRMRCYADALLAIVQGAGSDTAGRMASKALEKFPAPKPLVDNTSKRLPRVKAKADMSPEAVNAHLVKDYDAIEEAIENSRPMDLSSLLLARATTAQALMLNEIRKPLGVFMEKLNIVEDADAE